MADTINGIEITVPEEVVRIAVEEFLNMHVFKDSMKVVQVSSAHSAYDPQKNLIMVHKVTCASELSRLAGETNH